MRLVISLVLVAMLAATSMAASLTSATQATIKSLSSLSGSKFDVAFMQAFIPVHEEAVEIAMAATLNADHTQLLKWNQVVVERKNEQVRTMIAMLKASGARPAKRNVGVQTASVKKMRQLKDAALEKAYIPLMASHLDQTAALAQLASKKASRPELRALAAKIVKQENQDAATLRTWLKAWYKK
jgi:uncharacterized protein (DUF305 family)